MHGAPTCLPGHGAGGTEGRKMTPVLDETESGKWIDSVRALYKVCDLQTPVPKCLRQTVIEVPFCPITPAFLGLKFT